MPQSAENALKVYSIHLGDNDAIAPRLPLIQHPHLVRVLVPEQIKIVADLLHLHMPKRTLPSGSRPAILTFLQFYMSRWAPAAQRALLGCPPHAHDGHKDPLQPGWDLQVSGRGHLHEGLLQGHGLQVERLGADHLW